jgi:hypothetical protein
VQLKIFLITAKVTSAKSEIDPKQWVVIANARNPGGGCVHHHDERWFYADDLGRHEPNHYKADVEYSMFSDIAGKGFDLGDWEAVYRFACAYCDGPGSLDSFRGGIS